MPKVGKIKLKYDSEFGKDHDIYYTSKEGFTVKGLPSDFHTLTDLKYYGYNSEGDLTSALLSACHKYREAKVNTKMVIMYKCVASTELRMNKVSDGSYQGLLPGVSREIDDIKSRNCIAQFGIDFMVMSVVGDGVSREYYRVDSVTKEVKGRYSVSPREYQEMDYTEEREQFFLNLVESMKKMVVAASTFFGADPEQAALFIEQNQKLLN
mgnify:CR=1 FL=1